MTTMSDRHQFETMFNRVPLNIADRIGTPAMHGEYGQDVETARETFVPPGIEDFEVQKKEMLNAYLSLTNYDRSRGRDPAVSLVLLPPQALLEVEVGVRDLFLEDFAGARVVDEEKLITGVADEWKLAVIQGDGTGGHAEKDPEPVPRYLRYMATITPLGYAAMGGSIDRGEMDCTSLDAVKDGEQIQAYGRYVHGGTQSPPDHKRKSERTPDDGGKPKPAQIIISSEQPQFKPPSPLPIWGHFRPMPARRRLMYWEGLEPRWRDYALKEVLELIEG